MHLSRNQLSLILLSLSMLGIAACGGDDQPVRVTLGAGAKETGPGGEFGSEFRFGIGAMISPGTTVEIYGKLVEELGRHLGRRGVAVQRKTYAEINDLLEQRRLDCALVCTGAYLSGRKKFGMEVLLVPQLDGKLTYNSAIIVNADSGLAKFEELKGRKFALVDPLSNTGRFYPISRVLDLGGRPKEFFRTQFTHGHDRSIRAVKAGIVDAAAVDELILSYLERTEPKLVEGLKVIERSPPYGAPPIAVHPLTTAAERSRLRAAFISLAESESGKKILSGLAVEAFVAPPPDLYETAARLEERVRKYEQGEGGR